MFNLGEVVMTRPALAFCEANKFNALILLGRHLSGDWGDLAESDKAMNDAAVVSGDDRIVSAYNVHSEKFFVITEHDRSYTTIMLAKDY